MNSREAVISYCLSLADAYEDYPFHDQNWTVMRYGKNKKSFAYIYAREGQLCVNVKTEPEWAEFWRKTYPWVVPGFHMNKRHWNTLLLSSDVPREVVERMIGESYDLVI